MTAPAPAGTGAVEDAALIAEARRLLGDVLGSYELPELIDGIRRLARQRDALARETLAQRRTEPQV